MLEVWRGRLETEALEAVRSSTGGMPAEFRDALSEIVCQSGHQDLSLLACAASLWCGADPETGLPAATGVLLLRTGIFAHLSLGGFRERLHGLSQPMEGWSDAVTILAGDGLIALGMERLAEGCGRHSAAILTDAVNALGAHGVLAGLSLEMETGRNSLIVPDGRRIWEVSSGRISGFAARAGARLAGASDILLDDAGMAGLLVGRARFLEQGGWMPSMEGLKGKTAFEASTLKEQAEEILGHGPGSALFLSILHPFFGT